MCMCMCRGYVCMYVMCKHVTSLCMHCVTGIVYVCDVLVCDMCVCVSDVCMSVMCVMDVCMHVTCMSVKSYICQRTSFQSQFFLHHNQWGQPLLSAAMLHTCLRASALPACLESMVTMLLTTLLSLGPSLTLPSCSCTFLSLDC